MCLLTGFTYISWNREISIACCAMCENKKKNSIGDRILILWHGILYVSQKSTLDFILKYIRLHKSYNWYAI